MSRSWTTEITAWWRDQGNRRPRRNRPTRLTYDGSGRGSIIGYTEVLESRRLLTNVVAVTVSGNSISLVDASSGSSTGDNFTLTYTSTQVVLTGQNGTQFRVGDQTQSTYTATITGPAAISMSLSSQANTVSITGDGTASLASLNVNLGSKAQSNSLTVNKTITGAVTINGGASNDVVTFDQSTINGNLSVKLGNTTSDTLNIEETTVNGHAFVFAGAVFIEASHISGNLADTQSGKNNSLMLADASVAGLVAINMGQYSTVTLISSAAGKNHFSSAVSFMGVRHKDITILQHADSVTYDVTPSYKHAGVVIPSIPTITAPTVVSQPAAATATPKITGTYDATNSPKLSVSVAGKTYTLGTDSQLTAPTTGNWQLDLTGSPLTDVTNPVVVTAANSAGDTKGAVGTVTNQQAVINSYLTKNNLTATKTSTGLDYVVTTQGTGAVPTSGSKVTVNYSGFLLNADGTLGTEFDSNVDSKFNHVSPFQFTVGKGTVIPGWDQAFALLPVGTVAQLLIPSSLAYGVNGSSPNIPSNAILVFKVTLVSSP